MAERVGEVKSQSQARDVTLLKKYSILEVLQVDDADTITVDALTTIDSVKVIDLADATDVTVDIATNVITINDVGVSADHLLVTAVGT